MTRPVKHIKLYIYLILGVVFISNGQQQEFINQIDKDEKKYVQFYYDAEKYKILEEYEQALVMYEKCTAVNPKESSA